MKETVVLSHLVVASVKLKGNRYFSSVYYKMKWG